MRKLLSLTCLVLAAAVRAASNDSALDLKIATQFDAIVRMAAEPEIVNAVLAQNRALPPAFAAMTQEKWAALDNLDPFVFQFKSNAVGKVLQKLPHPLTSEAFVNDAAGYKVGFLEKTTNWRHRGKPKHDQPMAGAIWRGPVELDASSGTKQVQVAVPILSDGKPIGSLVVGLNIFELAKL